jgi:hypothetical protein
VLSHLPGLYTFHAEPYLRYTEEVNWIDTLKMMSIIKHYTLVLMDEPVAENEDQFYDYIQNGTQPMVLGQLRVNRLRYFYMSGRYHDAVCEAQDTAAVLPYITQFKEEVGTCRPAARAALEPCTTSLPILLFVARTHAPLHARTHTLTHRVLLHVFAGSVGGLSKPPADGHAQGIHAAARPARVAKGRAQGQGSREAETKATTTATIATRQLFGDVVVRRVRTAEPGGVLRAHGDCGQEPGQPEAVGRFSAL